MSAVAIARGGLVEQIDTFCRRIDAATTEEARAAYDRLGMAREWAKLQEDAAVLAERLVWLEAVILRRIGQLDPTAIPGPRRAAARHFAGLDDAALSSLVTDYPARSAVSAYNLWAKAQGIRASTSRGRDRATGRMTQDSAVDNDDDISDSLRYVVATRITNVRQAAAVILDEYVAGRPTTIAEVVDEFIADELPDMTSLEHSAFRRGLTAAVREAFAEAPVTATMRSWEIPAFITTYDEESDLWVRIPSEVATVGDARKMLALRRGQVESATRSLAALEGALEGRFNISRRDPGDFLRDDTTALAHRLRALERQAV